ncbi:hypothetical protein PR003_g33506 [Phytophthora rubi]|uniref:Retrotransposon gag domain-containing protein n=1 Tax=Phytophthora rubi TaxID=129364 RepID=A0A6A3GLC7_9STRA|nr:hypothetical protein PR002_g32011 [Phytophthora rubi]KAE8957440.1 hypothetical protein PR001_g31374 [Phytophthora rubi]KAE9262535.1 hypothetical protein PR003_g33506 [Phytophthora rubi]
MAVPEDELYADWDVGSNSTPCTKFHQFGARESSLDVPETKETPTYSGANDDDIDVYVLNVISWYAAYGLYLGQDQVDWRVGELMLNHAKGKAKKWLLQDYKGERRWSHIVKKMKQRFVTRSREEDLVASFFYCNQGNRSLDVYIDEFQRLGRTNDVSDKIKMI